MCKILIIFCSYHLWSTYYMLGTEYFPQLTGTILTR